MPPPGGVDVPSPAILPSVRAEIETAIGGRTWSAAEIAAVGLIPLHEIYRLIAIKRLPAMRAMSNRLLIADADLQTCLRTRPTRPRRTSEASDAAQA